MKKQNNGIGLALPYFFASLWFLIGVFTRQTIWLILGIITLAAASLLTIYTAKKYQAAQKKAANSSGSPVQKSGNGKAAGAAKKK